MNMTNLLIKQLYSDYHISRKLITVKSSATNLLFIESIKNNLLYNKAISMIYIRTKLTIKL